MTRNDSRLVVERQRPSILLVVDFLQLKQQIGAKLIPIDEPIARSIHLRRERERKNEEPIQMTCPPPPPPPARSNLHKKRSHLLVLRRRTEYLDERLPKLGHRQLPGSKSRLEGRPRARRDVVRLGTGAGEAKRLHETL